MQNAVNMKTVTLPKVKKYCVTICLIDGYYDREYNEPRIKQVDFTVLADDEKSAIEIAKRQDKSHLSVWESYANEI
jgi:hypothetical protein